MTLYIEENCGTCARVRESLEDTAIAHKTIVVPAHGKPDGLPEGIQPPVLVDDGQVIQGSGGIFAYIEEIRLLTRDWLKYQSDVCYCD
jgi:glutaredoxin